MNRRQIIGRIVLSAVISFSKAKAQMPIAEIIKQGIKKVIVAADLKVQRIQNKTIWLQNAQKEMENILSRSKLGDISEWVQMQKDLYGDYFDELWKVKDAIALYHRVKEISDKQIKIVSAYRQTYKLFKQDAHFTPGELDYMGKVYEGIIEESLKNIDQLILVISPGATQMSDGNRIDIINSAGSGIDKNYKDLQAFNNENKLLSLQRSKDKQEIAFVKILYGLN
ncbi:MAG: conjugal transfer protein TraI [Bacteroidota bacterium]|nr:conjugal transfer protein TraI [Bacteroidota bacterium]